MSSTIPLSVRQKDGCSCGPYVIVCLYFILFDALFTQESDDWYECSDMQGHFRQKIIIDLAKGTLPWTTVFYVS